MKRFALVCVVLICIVSSNVVIAAEGDSASGDRLDINPMPPQPVQPKKETDPLEAIGGYLWARVRDLGDIVTLKLGWGNYRSIGFQAKATSLIQIGAGNFEGWVFAIDRGCVGTMKEAEMELGLSLFYLGWISRQVVWETEDAKKRNVFFGDVGEKKAITLEEIKMYDDENSHPMQVGAQVQLPCLPKIELFVNLGEIFDFPLSFFHIGGFRVPQPFYKQDGPDGEKGERIPAPSIFWHGQEEYERYE